MNIKNSKGFSVIELIIVLVILLIIGVTISGALGNYSNGDRVGTITKFSHKGILWTTYEGELVMGGVATNQNGGAVANVWDFSVTNPEVASEIQKAMDNGTPIKLHYNQVLVARPWNGSTTYYVDAVSALGEKK